MPIALLSNWHYTDDKSREDAVRIYSNDDIDNNFYPSNTNDITNF